MLRFFVLLNCEVKNNRHCMLRYCVTSLAPPLESTQDFANTKRSELAVTTYRPELEAVNTTARCAAIHMVANL